MDAIIAREGRQSEIGDDEPLRRAPAVILVPLALIGAGLGGFGEHHVDAGLHVLDGLGDRKGRDDVLIEVAFRLERAGPDLLAFFGGDGRCGRAGNLLEEIL